MTFNTLSTKRTEIYSFIDDDAEAELSLLFIQQCHEQILFKFVVYYTITFHYLNDMQFVIVSNLH